MGRTGLIVHEVGLGEGGITGWVMGHLGVGCRGCLGQVGRLGQLRVVGGHPSSTATREHHSFMRVVGSINGLSCLALLLVNGVEFFFAGAGGEGDLGRLL